MAVIRKCLRCRGWEKMPRSDNGRWRAARWSSVTLKGKHGYHIVALSNERPGRYYATSVYDAETPCGLKFVEEQDHGD